MEILYLSHCVPNPPDKGEKIRAHYEVKLLAEKHRVHVVCFGRHPRELRQAEEMKQWCASVHVEMIQNLPNLAQAGLAFLTGSSLNVGYYRNSTIHRRVEELSQKVRLDCSVAYSAVMARFLPDKVPYVLDLIDVDSEKWLTFEQQRFPGWFFGTEARRLRKREIEFARRASVTFLATANERDIFRRVTERALPVEALENGVDTDYYDPATTPRMPAISGQKYLAFTGAFNSFANVDGAVWFVNEVFPLLRDRVDADLGLYLVGRDPSASVQRLTLQKGVKTTGYIEDARPYLLHAAAVVAPLRVARGIQNKVLEGLAMDKPVLVSPAVGKTFGGEIPPGVTVCSEPRDYADALLDALANPAEKGVLRQGVMERYNWRRNLTPLVEACEAVG